LALRGAKGVGGSSACRSRSPWTARGVFGLSASELPVGAAGLDDVVGVRQAVEHGGGHRDVTEHLGPVGEARLVVIRSAAFS